MACTGSQALHHRTASHVAQVDATVSHTPALLRPSWSSMLARASRDDAAHSRDAEATAAMMAMHEPGKAGCREPATENPQD